MANKKRELPTALAFMQAHAGNQASGNSGQPVSAFGKGGPSKGDSANVGFKSVNSHGQPSQGQSTPASKARGHGAKKKELSPNNTRKAGSSTKGKPGHGLPSHNAIHRRLYGATPVATPKPNSGGVQRSGILAKFEGFSKNQ
jgi:hypothetical protein